MIGSIFEARYQIISTLGEGASGITYKAKDVLLDRLVAVKVLHSHLLSNAASVDRFRKESISTAAINHKGVARVYAHGISEAGQPYMVMDLIEGPTLEELIRQQGKLELQRFFTLMLQTLDALKTAHEQGIIHRDIKPGNIIITKDEKGEQAVIIDFGIAKMLNAEGEQSSTQTGMLLGSTAYMSPEQCAGTAVDNRSDIYSIGCVMLECLTGEAPFKGATALDVMYKHMHQSLNQLGFLRIVPEPLAKIISRCLQKNITARYQSIAELMKDLNQCAEHQDSLAARKTPLNKLGMAGLAVVIVAVAAGLVRYGVMQKTEPTKKDNSPMEWSSKKNTLTNPKGKLSKIRQSIFDTVDLYKHEGASTQLMAYLRLWEHEYANSNSTPSDSKALVFTNISQVLCADGDFDGAQKYMALALKYDNSPVSRTLAAEENAKILLSKSQPQEAVNLLSSVLADTGNDILQADVVHYSKAFTELGDAYYNAKDFRAATKNYDKVIVAAGRSHVSGWNPNSLRAKEIVCLTRLGEKRKCLS